MRPFILTGYDNWELRTNAAHDSQIFPVFWCQVDMGVPAYGDLTNLYPTFSNTGGESGKSKGIIQSITLPKQSIKPERQTFSITYSGLRTDMLADALLMRQDIGFPTSRYDIGLGFIDMWFYNPVTEIIDPDATYTVAMGLLESVEIVEDAPNPLVTFTFAQSTDWQWDQPHEGRYTDAYQKAREISGVAAATIKADRGFEYVEKLQDWELFWAKPKPAKKKGKRGKHGKGRGK